MSQYIGQEFKGSKAAEKFACGRTKSSAIVSCIGNNFFQQLNTDMQKFPFSMMLDASNDIGLYKIFPITLHKKWSFPLRISLVNVIKSACHIYWRNP